jgi:hypothetical protein
MKIGSLTFAAAVVTVLLAAGSFPACAQAPLSPEADNPANKNLFPTGNGYKETGMNDCVDEQLSFGTTKRKQETSNRGPLSIE